MDLFQPKSYEVEVDDLQWSPTGITTAWSRTAAPARGFADGLSLSNDAVGVSMSPATVGHPHSALNSSTGF